MCESEPVSVIVNVFKVPDWAENGVRLSRLGLKTGVILLGAHARAGTPNGFLAHTGTGAVKGLWLNDIEVGEGELNAAFPGDMGVPV